MKIYVDSIMRTKGEGHSVLSLRDKKMMMVLKLEKQLESCPTDKAEHASPWTIIWEKIIICIQGIRHASVLCDCKAKVVR